MTFGLGATPLFFKLLVAHLAVLGWIVSTQVHLMVASWAFGSRGVCLADAAAVMRMMRDLSSRLVATLDGVAEIWEDAWWVVGGGTLMAFFFEPTAEKMQTVALRGLTWLDGMMLLD